MNLVKSLAATSLGMFLVVLWDFYKDWKKGKNETHED